jgi:hypothetical protein
MAIIKVKDDGFYIPMDGPWDSEEDDAAYKEACDLFDERRPLHDYLVLIISHHLATSGYWIETVKRDVSFPDRILKGGETILVSSTVKVKTKRVKK